jgi:HlyD family secretion protein
MTATNSKPKVDRDRNPPVRGLVSLALAIVILLLGGFGAWATYAELSGAVIASGTLVVDSNVKKVQHPTGGVVGAIYVKNGDVVSAGDIVMRLDETQVKANLGVYVSQLVQLWGRNARLEAERDGHERVKFPEGFEDLGSEARSIAAGERRLFEARQLSKNGQRSQLKERVGQVRREIQGLNAQRDAKNTELELMREELDRLQELRRKDLIPQPRILSAQRDLAKLQGEWGALEAQIARSLGSIAETELQIIGLDQTMQTDANKDLRDNEARVAELTERRIAAEDQLKRIDITAPQTGLVHEMSVHTTGGVIGPSETLMLIVPNNDALAIEVKVAPNDIDQVALGQSAIIRFSAFNQRTTPEIVGEVSRVAADITKDNSQANAPSYYTLRVRPLANELEKLSKLKLMPGMPVEAFIQTGSRTMGSYLLKPLLDQFARAFKEE